MFGLSLVETEFAPDQSPQSNEQPVELVQVRDDSGTNHVHTQNPRRRKSSPKTLDELDKSGTGYTCGNLSTPNGDLLQQTPITEQCQSISSHPEPSETRQDDQSREYLKSVPTSEQIGAHEPSAALSDETTDKSHAFKLSKPAMFRRQYKVWEAERKPFVDCLLHEVLAAELTIFCIGWNENFTSRFLPYYLACHVIVSLLTQLTVPMFHDHGVVMRKLNVMTLFHFITLFIVSSTIILSCLSSYGDFYVVKDAAAAHSSMEVLKLDIDSCEAACARSRTCVLYQHRGSDCRLFNTTLEQADLGPLEVRGSTLAVKKIVKSSRYESDGQLYYLTDLVQTGHNCSRCRKMCEGYFHVAHLPRSSEVLRDIVKRGDALNHPVLYEEGLFVPFCWNLDGQHSCDDSNAMDFPAKFRVYHSGKDLSNFKKKSVKVLCQASPLGRSEISETKMVFELRTLCKEWLDSIIYSYPLFRTIATDLNESWFDFKNVLSAVLLHWYSLAVEYIHNIYEDMIFFMEGED